MEFGLKKVNTKRTTMSVPEMRKLLGLGKTESYHILKKNYFKVITVNGHYRIDLQSFEEWYAGQWHYQKVEGPPPGAKLLKYMTVKEVGHILGIKKGAADWIVRESGRFRLYTVDGLLCILRHDFEDWYQHQCRYTKIAGEPPGRELPPSYTGQDISEMLGIPLRNAVYELTSKKLFRSEIIDGQLRIDKESFDAWFINQNEYLK